MKQYDAIMIPGGGLRADGTSPDWVKARLERALNLAMKTQYLIVLSAGTVHKPPPYDHKGFPISEAKASAQFLLEHGIEAKQILVENCSYDTVGNAYYSRLLHVEPLKLERILVITSEFHGKRTETAFRWIYHLLPYREVILDFETVQDIGLTKEELIMRHQREAENLEKLYTLIQRIHTLRDFHQWMYSEHKAYAVGQEPTRAVGKVLNSY